MKAVQHLHWGKHKSKQCFNKELAAFKKRQFND